MPHGPRPYKRLNPPSLPGSERLYLDGELTRIEQALGATIEALGEFKVGSTTRDLTAATGTQAVTGVGFKPRALVVFGVKAAAVVASWGFSDATTHQSIWVDGANYNTSAHLVRLRTAATPDEQYATLSSFDADGFTLSWTKAGTPAGTGTLIYLAFK